MGGGQVLVRKGEQRLLGDVQTIFAAPNLPPSPEKKTLGSFASEFSTQTGRETCSFQETCTFLSVCSSFNVNNANISSNFPPNANFPGVSFPNFHFFLGFLYHEHKSCRKHKLHLFLKISNLPTRFFFYYFLNYVYKKAKRFTRQKVSPKRMQNGTTFSCMLPIVLVVLSSWVEISPKFQGFFGPLVLQN